MPPELLLLLLAALQGVAAQTHRISSEYIRVGLTVADGSLGLHTYLSELSLNQDMFAGSAGFGWSPNLLANSTQPMPPHDPLLRARLSGTALVTWDGNNSTWHAPQGGAAVTALSSSGGSIGVKGIELGNAAKEDWTVTVDGPSLTWAVNRVMGSVPFNATCDRMPALIFNAEYTETGHVLASSAQIPSLLDPSMTWDASSGRGFVCEIGEEMAGWGYWAEGVSNRTTNEIQLSPSMMRMASAAARDNPGRPLMSAISMPPGLGGYLGLGYSTVPPAISPPAQNAAVGWWGSFIMVCADASHCGAQYFVPPDNKTKYHIEAASCGLICAEGMPAACSDPVKVSQAYADALTTGRAFSCSEVPSPPSIAERLTALHAHESLEVTWTLTVGEGSGVAPLALTTGDDALDKNFNTLGAIFNMWSGNILGNSPASVVCLHEMSFFPMVQSVFHAPKDGPDSVHSAMKSQLLMFAQHAQKSNGFIFPRWDGHSWEDGCIHDQMAHFILAYYYHVRNTGDKEFLLRVWPSLNRAMEYVLGPDGMGMGGREGLATTPCASGLPHANTADNWFDIVNFGGKDAVINSYLVTALSKMEEMAEYLGGVHAGESGKWQRLHSAAVSSFNTQLWNASVGLYSDWIDTAGGRRNYFYVWQQFNAIDPASGIANSSRAAAMMATIDRFYGDIRARYNKTQTELWCTPTNLDAARGANWSGIAWWDSVLQNGVELGDQQYFGHYENGCCFMALTGLEIAARGQAGDPDGAAQLVKRAMDNFNATRFWGQHFDWCGGEHCEQPAAGFNAGDVLTNSIMVLYGAVHSLFGFRTDLRGVHVVGRPATTLREGASHSFTHLGERVTLTVQGGKTVVSHG